MRFYANENFPFSTVRELRNLGHDVLTTLDAKQANQSIPDDRVLQFANDSGRALLTLNGRDFFQLHNRGAAHVGIVACTIDTDALGQATRIHAAVGGRSALGREVVRVNRLP